MLNDHQVRSVIACLPDWFRNYAALHLDTIPKLINHLLVLVGVSNVTLFMKSWNVTILPGMGLQTPLVATLLCCQNVCVWMILNDTAATMATTRLVAWRPTEFMIGNCLGITIGAAFLAMVLSNYFHNLGRCNNNVSMVGASIMEYVCENPRERARVASVAFWSGLVFWLEFCLSLLIALGRQDLVRFSNTQSYENLSTQDDDPEEHFRQYTEQQQRQQQQQQNQTGTITANGILGTFAGSLATSFGSDYSTVPDIRNAEHASIGSSGHSNTIHHPLGSNLNV
jgi:hypothetical protein